MTNLDLKDPSVRRLLKRIAHENRSDPFAVRRAISRINHGIIDLSDLSSKKQLPSFT